MATLEGKLARIRVPNQQNQKQVAVVLSAVEDILRDQGASEFTATAYFAALLSLLTQAISPSGIADKDLAASIVYLLDIVTPFTPAPLLRSKFHQILTNLAPALTNGEAEPALLRSSVGCLESLLIVQDATAWAIPQSEVGPRAALAGLLRLSLDERPKVRKRAQEAVTKVLQNSPPTPSLDHPASDMCAMRALQSVVALAKSVGEKSGQNDPRLIHSIQLTHAVATAGGWPSQRMEELIEVLLKISRSSNQYLSMAVFGVFEAILSTDIDEFTSAKLPRIIEAISESRPSQNDSQLFPPWLAVLARGYEAFSMLEPEMAYAKLPGLFDMVSQFLESSSHEIRSSAAQCLLVLVTNCIPDEIILGNSTEGLKEIATRTGSLLSVRFQGAWAEVFTVINCLFDKLQWKSDPVMGEIVSIIGQLRSNEGFQGKKEADEVLGHAIRAMGPEAVLRILPLNLAVPKAGQAGRAWLLPILRDYTQNTNLSHFLSEMVPLSEIMFQRILEQGEGEKTVEGKIFETIIQQIWSILPGYCNAPLDLRKSFDQSFAELLANVLYKQVELRPDVCKALQLLVKSNEEILEVELDDGQEDLIEQRRITKAEAKKNLELLSSLSGNLLAVLFNVYSQTLPKSRAFILRCIDAYLRITQPNEIVATFARVTSMLEGSLADSIAPTQAERERQKKTAPADNMPPMAHTLMDLVITIAPYLPVEGYDQLLLIFTAVINKKDDPQLQKKAYKVISRMTESESGRKVLSSRVEELQKVLLNSAETATAPARRDRLEAIANMVDIIPSHDLHFIPSVLSEVVISTKEINERARTEAFNLLVSMAHKMKQGGTVVNSKVPGMPATTPSAKASLEEYFTMVSAGLAGSTPHMISASITALTRILFEFKDDLPSELVNEMVTTMDLFLTSKNREIVGSVLGFVKVCIISLPEEMMIPKLSTLIPNLMVWSHEHKSHFKAKVKHMIERAIRRFGYDMIERHVPEEDKKLVINIRKTRDRKKRQKKAENGEDAAADTRTQKKQSRFASEYEEAIYGSESEDGSDQSDNEGGARGNGKREKGQRYIMEDEDEPLDLLDKKSLANISSTKPQKARAVKQRTKAKTNEDGKLMLGGDSDDEDGGAGDDDMGIDENQDIGAAVSAYVQAISGRNAVQRGRGGRLKFSNKKNLKDDDGDDDMADAAAPKKNGAPQKNLSRRDSRGLGAVRGGRVQKGRGGNNRGRR